MNDAEKPQRLVPIEWRIPESIISRYATNLIVQHTPHEFIIYFFEAIPPLIMGGTSEAAKEQVEKIGSVPAECVARIVISAQRMPEFIEVFQTSMQQYLQNMEQLSEDK